MHCGTGFHHTDPGIIPVEEGMVLRRKVFQDLAFGFGDVFQGPQQFQMGIPHIGDHRRIRIGDMLHGPDLTQAPHAHFHHSHFRVFPDGQKGLGQTDFVVEVGLGLDHPVFFPQHCGNAVLGGSLAVAAGNGDHRQAFFVQPVPAGDLLVGRQGIGHHHAPVRRHPCRHFRHHRRPGSVLQSLGHEPVAVELLPFQGHKQAPGHNGPGIGYHIRKFFSVFQGHGHLESAFQQSSIKHWSSPSGKSPAPLPHRRNGWSDPSGSGNFRGLFPLSSPHHPAWHGPSHTRWLPAGR